MKKRITEGKGSHSADRLRQGKPFMAFLKLCSALKSAKVGKVLGKRYHLGVECVCVCVDCRFLFSTYISAINLQKCVAV